MTMIIPYIVFGSLVLFGGLFVLLLLLVVWDAMRSRRWPAAVGKVVRSGIATEVRDAQSDRPPTWVIDAADIAYEYQIGGEKLTGSNVYVGNARSGGPRQAQRIANRYPVGSDVLVYYNPADHKEAVLEPGLPAGLWKLAVIGIPILAIGIGGILAMSGLLRIQDAELKLIIGIPIALIGGAVSCVALLNLRLGAASKHWPPAQGQVLASLVRQSGGRDRTVYEPHIVYQYMVGETAYSHSAIDLGGVGSSCEAVTRYPVGAAVTVFYDPVRPERAVLEPGSRWSNLILLAVGLPFLVAGTALVVCRLAG